MLLPDPEMLFLALVTQATSEPTSHLTFLYLLTVVGLPFPLSPHSVNVLTTPFSSPL